MADVMSGFGGFANLGNVALYIAYFFGFLIVGAILVGIVIFIMVQASKKEVWEINLVNRKIKRMSAREKKNKSGRRQLYVGKLKKFLPKLQQQDIFLKGKKEIILLLKDNNALHHSLRVPNLEEIKEWYEAVYEIDIEKEFADIEKQIDKSGPEYDEKERAFGVLDWIKRKFQGSKIIDEALTVISTIYLLPNPLEDLNWMADQAIESDKTFTAEWWKSPAFLWGSTLVVCLIMFIMTLILSKKM